MQQKRNTIWWIVLVAGLLLINFIASVVHFRADLTEDKRYSLGTNTKTLFSNLSDPLEIEVFLKGDMPSEFRKLSDASREFLTVLKEANPSKIRYSFIDPQDEMSNGRRWADTLVSLGASPINLSVQVKAGEENKIIFPYSLIHYHDRVELVNLFQSSKRNITVAELNNAQAMMEYQFAKAADQISNPDRPLVAYAIGNKEPTGPEVFSLQQTIDPEHAPQFESQYFNTGEKSKYQLGLYNLQTQKSIPDTFKVLIIVKPDSTFTDAEKLKIDQYIMRGGKVLWFVDNLHAEPDSLSMKSQLIAYERNLNLQDLFFKYGVRINPDLIMDLQCDFLPFAVGGSAGQPQFEFLHWNYYPLFEPKNSHAVTKNLGLIAGRFVNSIDTVETDNVSKKYLLQSSPNSRILNTPVSISPNENRNTASDVLYRLHDIPAAVLLEGSFTSLYKGRVSQAQRDTLSEVGGYLDHSVNTKMIVVADGDMVLNDVTSKGPLPMGMNAFTVGSQYEYQFANRDFLLNCLEYLTGKSSIMETRNKEIVLRLLDPRKVNEEKTKWQLVNIVLPILIIVIFGIVYQQVRRYRYAK